MIETFNDLDCDVLLVTETRRKEKEELWKTPDGHMFMGSGWQGGRRGVAVILHRRLAKSFKGFYPVSEQACAVDLDIRGAKLRLIAAYLPDSSYDDAEVEETYYQLGNLCNKARQTERSIILGGDLNAVIGNRRPGDEKVIGPFGSGTRNA